MNSIQEEISNLEKEIKSSLVQDVAKMLINKLESEVNLIDGD